MKYTDNAINILTVKSYKGVGRAWVVKHLKGNEDLSTIISLLNSKLKSNETITIEKFELKKNQIIDELKDYSDNCDGITAIGDKNFPRYRGQVKGSEQPIFLFFKGNIKLLDINNRKITVIGLLNPEKEIEEREKNIVNIISKKNITIVSGLALGCDSIAHQQAILSSKTIAILPSPLNDILPSKNKTLADEIVAQGGLLVTEYYDKFKSKMELSSRYKERDRLQALFCDTIILAASYARDSATRWNIIDKKLDSGARLAMEYAKSYNIPRAVIYNEDTDSNNPMFDLNRKLVNEDNSVTILTKKNLNEIVRKITIGKDNKIVKSESLNLF